MTKLKLLQSIFTAFLIWGTLFFFLPQAQAQQIKIANSQQIPKALNRNLQNIQLDSLQLANKEFDELYAQLEQYNYLFARIEQHDSTLHIQPNKAYEIHIPYVLKNKKKDISLHQQLRNCNYLFELQQWADQTQKDHQNKGFPFVAVSLEKLTISENKIVIIPEIKTGKYTHLHKVHFYSKSITNTNKLLRLLHLRHSSAFNQKKINQINTQLFSTGFLKPTKQPEVFFVNNKCHLGVYVEKKKANQLDGIIGLLQDENNTLQFTGFLNLRLANAFRQFENISLSWRKTDQNFQSININANLPYLFRSNWGVATHFELQQIDSTQQSILIQPKLSFQLKAQQKIFVFYHYQTAQVVSLAAKTTKSLSKLIGLEYELLHTNHTWNPSKGITLNLEFALGQRSQVETEEKWRALLKFQSYVPAYKRLVVAAKLEGGTVNHQSNEYLDTELFSVGGYGSIRGFAENSFFTRSYASSAVELRFLIDQDSHFLLFSDQAILQQTNEQRKILWGIGFGLQFGTRAGLLSVSYGLGRQESIPFDIAAGKLHFGYKNRF